MEIVYLLAILAGVAAFGLIVYLGVACLTKRVKKDGQRAVIMRAIRNDDPQCDCCNGNCDKFIDEVLAGTKSVDDCPKISSVDKIQIKELLGIKPNVSSSKVAHIFCKGGLRAADQYGYHGAKSCDYSNKLYDGSKVCRFGCQGCMDCAKVCPTGAIIKNKVGVAEVDRSLCVGCGKCEKACPDELIKLIDISQPIAITCKQCENQKSGEEVSKFCGVGCTKCGECVSACPTGALYKENGLIKYNCALCINCTKCVNICPNSTISSIKSDFVKF